MWKSGQREEEVGGPEWEEKAGVQTSFAFFMTNIFLQSWLEKPNMLSMSTQRRAFP